MSSLPNGYRMMIMNKKEWNDKQEIFEVERDIIEYLIEKYPLNDYLIKRYGNPLIEKRLKIDNKNKIKIKRIINNTEDIQLYEKVTKLPKIRRNLP